MRFKAFVKSDFSNLGIQDILKSRPSVLLGVSQAIEQTLQTLRIRTVFDLALSTLFTNASHVLSDSGDIRSVYRKFGRAPASVIDKAQLTIEEVTSLPLDEITTLIGVGPKIGPVITNQLSIKSIRDLALWPPYLAAKAIVIEAYNPPLPAVDFEAPRELVPASGEFGTERHLYSSVVMFPGTYNVAKPLNNTLFDIAETGLIGFNRMRFGARITYSQTWFPKYVAKGQLLHSLPLAPGESTNVAVIDWTNKSKAATQQDISESERLYSTNDRTRTVSQISASVARDFESGSSETLAQSASASAGGTAVIGIGFGTLSGSLDESTSATHTVSTGSRSIATSLQESIVDSTQQNSSGIRSQRAAVVSEVSQSDSQKFSTRNITNYNHMHALTFQYYEVVQIYETQVRQEDVERCIFIPMVLFDFRDERIIFKYLSILKRVALNYNTTSILRQLEAKPFGYTLKWGLTRVPTALLSNSIGRQIVRAMTQSYRTLHNRGFLSVKGSPVFKADLQLNCQLQLNNVVVVNSRTQSPRSLVSGVDIDLEDGSTVTVTTTPVGAPGDAGMINPAFNGKPISFGQIRAMRLKTTNYNTSPTNFAQRAVNVLLAVKLNGESRFLDASFMMVTGSNANAELFSIDALPEVQQVEEELIDHQLYYSQQIWLRENPQNLIMQFAPLRMTIGGNMINLVDYIMPVPLKVVGNYLVYKFTYEKDGEWRKWLAANFDRSRVSADMVAVPTGGVFAEAVLGRFNCAEKLDVTRFANWNDSPPPNKPPTIGPVKFTEPALPTVPPQATFSAPIVNIQNPINLPAPTGLADVLVSIVKGGTFADVSGLTQSGDVAVKATEVASADSLAAMKASGDALAQLMSSISKVLQTFVSKDATKTLSDVGALLNTKDAKQDQNSQKNGSSTEKGDSTAPNSSNGKATETHAEAQVLDGAIQASALASLAAGDTGAADTATDASPADVLTTISSDQALLGSKLITEPLFTDVLGFLVLLMLIPDENLLDVVAKRFETLDKSVDPKAKFTELMNVFTSNNAQLMNADRILFALRFQKASVLPDNSTLDQDQIKTVKDLAVTKMVDRAFSIAKRVFSGSEVKDVMRNIFVIANESLLYDINQIAYVLATAYHESAMGKFMTELSNGVSTDTVFTKDEYFFNAIPGKKNSYNGINGNLLAGDQLNANGDIATPPQVATWNGNIYPNGETVDVKTAARACDFYRFIGRGLVQITGRTNYQRYSNQAAFGNVDFLANPEKVAEPPVAARILVGGMMAGDFRAHKLGDYDTAAGYDGVNARDIVNGDKAANGKRISDIAEEYKNSLIINAKLDESTAYV